MANDRPRPGLPDLEQVSDPDLRAIVESFVAAAVKPAMLDPGEEPLLLIADQWSVSEWNGRLVLQAWDQRRNLVRRIVGLKEQRRDRLCLTTERFPSAGGASDCGSRRAQRP